MTQATPIDIKALSPVRVLYCNWRGVTTARLIVPLDRYWGRTVYHPKPGWLIRGWDAEKQDWRTFAEADMRPA